MMTQPESASCGYKILTDLVDPDHPTFEWPELALTAGQVDLLRLTCNGSLYPIYYDISREFLSLRHDKTSFRKPVLPEDASFELTVYTISGKRHTYAFRTGRHLDVLGLAQRVSKSY